MSKQFNSSIEIKVDKSTLPANGQKVKFFVDNEWFKGEYDDSEEMFSIKGDQFWSAWQVREWQPVDCTPRRDHLPISREQAEKVWDAAVLWCNYDGEVMDGSVIRGKEQYLKQFDKQ